MNRDLDREIARIAGPQFGNFTYDQALALGMSPDELRWRVKTGRLDHPYGRLYRIAGTPLSWRSELLTACFAGGAHAVASHRSAAALWGFAGGRTDLVEITCPRWRRAKHDGLVVHESKAMQPGTFTDVDGIPVTTPEVTLLMLGALVSPLVVEMALDKGLNKGLVTFDSTQVVVDRMGRRGRNGAGVLRTILQARDPNRAPSESEMETLLLKVLRDNGLPAPVPQYEVYDGDRFVARVDAAYVDAQIAIEYESVQEHAGRRGLERDNPRRNALVAINWKPLGATHADVRNGGGALTASILRCVGGDLRLLASRRRA